VEVKSGMAVEKQRSASGSQTPVFLLKSLDFDSKKLLDMFGQNIVNFVVPGNRLFLAFWPVTGLR